MINQVWHTIWFQQVELVLKLCDRNTLKFCLNFCFFDFLLPVMIFKLFSLKHLSSFSLKTISWKSQKAFRKCKNVAPSKFYALNKNFRYLFGIKKEKCFFFKLEKQVFFEKPLWFLTTWKLLSKFWYTFDHRWRLF